MKKTLLYFALLLIIAGCAKTESDVSPENQFTISINNVINESINTNWSHVLGGEALLIFEQNGELIKDSLSLSNLPTFTKNIVQGKYDITLRTKSENIADSFIRFNAQLKDFDINNNVNLSFQCISNDGLITIKKELIKVGTTPVFSTTDNKQQKFGYYNNNFYLYVKGGTSGKITFIEKETQQTLIKELTINAGNQYNLNVVKYSAGAISIVFSQFNYNEVPVTSCATANPSVLSVNWINTKILTYSLSGSNWLFNNKVEPVGYFKLNSNATYNRLSDNVLLNGTWEINPSNCNLLLDKGQSIERSFEILKADQDSLVITRIEGNSKFVQYYYKGQ